MRLRGRVDKNQVEITKALRAAGCSVDVTSGMGHGFPDLCVGFAGRVVLMEVKSLTAGLTPDEVKWHKEHKGIAVVVRTPLQARRYAGCP